MNEEEFVDEQKQVDFFGAQNDKRVAELASQLRDTQKTLNINKEMLKGLIDSNCAAGSVKNLCDSLLTENADLLRQV